jgi:hypothetical protein
MDPINYLAGVPQEDFLRDIQGGLQLGAGIQQLQQQQQAQQLAQQRAAQYQADVNAFMQDPTPQAAAALQLKYPDQYEPISKAWAGLSADQQKNELRDTYSIASTLQANRKDLALQQIDDRIAAHKNSGMPTADLEALRTLVEQDPKAAYGQVLNIVSGLPGGDNVLKNLSSLGQEQRAADLAPLTLAEKRAAGVQQQQATLGQVIGGLANVDGVKPAQVQTAFKSLAAKGVISKDDLPAYLADIPTDPKLLKPYLSGFVQTALSPADQMKYTTPDANAKLSADTQLKTTGMNNATQLAVQKAISERQDSKGDTEPTLDPDTLTTMAQQYLAGDKGVMQNLGRGAQGSANVVALRQAITREAKAQGLSGPAIAAKMAEFAGTMAGQRTAGNRIANVEMAATEAQNLIPLARQASADVTRSGFLPFGKAQMMFNNQTNDPAMRQFVAANNSLVNVYARAISPSGTPTVADKEHAREMLSTAMDHKSYLAVLDQMQREIEAARQAPQAVRSAFSAGVTGQGHGAAPAAADHPADISVLLKKYGGGNGR